MNKGTGMMEPEESAAAIKRVCDQLEPSDAGRFLDWEGRPINW
mgnify:CR=1 FL=1